MSRWIDNFNKVNRRKLEKHIEQVKQEREEYRRNYNDFPYDRYQKAMERRDEELRELQMLLHPEEAKRELEDYKETVEYLRKMLHKCNILAMNIDPATEVSDNNVKRLIGMTDQFTDNYIEESFRAAAERGVW